MQTTFSVYLLWLCSLHFIWAHHTWKIGNNRQPKAKGSPRLEKYFQVGDPSLPGSWQAPPHSPHSLGPRWPDIEYVHSFYILEGRKQNPESSRAVENINSLRNETEEHCRLTMSAHRIKPILRTMPDILSISDLCRSRNPSIRKNNRFQIADFDSFHCDLTG